MTDPKRADVEAVAKAISDFYDPDEDLIFIKDAEIAISAYLSYLNERGLILVPKNPTENMIKAAFDSHRREAYPSIAIYKAMIGAYEAESTEK